ncbi:DJ-1/PfpI family protein [Pseudomonas sp. NPDC086581]|uniref:DJ-1/PfpI family protein n=1 Tax=Pseudomonas sp. NPDC086581 TaxID=3364432 RepID=UPI003827CE24
MEPLEHDVQDNSWVIPGIGVGDVGVLQQRLEEPWASPLLSALNTHVASDKEIAASCSAVFLLHAAGLLEGRRVTTSWWLAPHLRKIAPGYRVDPDFMVLADPPLTTAGAAFAQTDLMLHLLRRRLSPEIAGSVSKALLLDRRQLQSPFVIVLGRCLACGGSAGIAAGFSCSNPVGVLGGCVPHALISSGIRISARLVNVPLAILDQPC